tara:strand:- start:50 stop:382 length:333 start_codon:yes stop_codon:yes gene_type:complete
MMKANEFRLGNLVKCPEGFGQVTQIQDREVLVVDEIGYTMEVIKPIPLTEEWLLKFGFKKFKNYNDFSHKGIIIHGRKRGFVLRKSVPVIKHVHQLQNLYFALTGEELKQ